MKLEKYFLNFSTVPLMVGAIILGTAIEAKSFLHILAMILLIIAGIFMGIGFKRN